jgi:inorganic triphosphatase YgiF
VTAPRQTRERELKLEADDGFALPAIGGEPLDERLFTSTYYDSEDRRLARRGVTLRRRLENGSNLWQLKLPRGAARLEVEVAGGPAGAPPEVDRILAGLLRGAPVTPIATLRTRRVGVLVRDLAEGFAEVVVDRVAVLEGARVRRLLHRGRGRAPRRERAPPAPPRQGAPASGSPSRRRAAEALPRALAGRR